MSININLRIDGEIISLRQTPTHISYMCMVTDDGQIGSLYNGKLSGKKAIAAVRRYIAWVYSQANGVYESSETAHSIRCEIKKHSEDIIRKIEKSKTVEVWIQ